MTKHLTLPAIATVFAIALSAVVEVRMAHAAAGDIYNLGTLGGTSSAGSDINDADQAVGSAQDAMGHSRPFLWDRSRGMTELGTPNGYPYAWASAINASGSVAGTEHNETGDFRAFAWTPNQANGTTGTMTSLAVQDTSFANDINAAGQVVGHSTYVHFVEDSGCTPDAPYYPNCGGYWEYETNAVLWENGVGSGLTNSSASEVALAINNSGQVAGYFLYNDVDWHAFRYDRTPGNGVRHDLGTLGGSGSVGIAINNSGQVAGYSSTTGDAASHAFCYTGTPGAGGVMVDLGTLGGAHSSAVNINDAGFVVGQADRGASAGGGSWATLWRNDAGNTAVDLDAWLDAINPTLGAYWDLFAASAINNDGLITGTGYYFDGPGGLTDGSRAFVLDASSLVHPIPGDFNHDGTVDGADYIAWRKTGGTQAEYNTWRTHFGQPAGSGAGVSANAIPEPAAPVLLMFAAASCFLARRRVA